MVAVDIRPVADDELPAWVEASHVAFHNDQPVAEEVAFRREVVGQDLARTLGAFDDGRVVGTLLSFPAELSLPGGTFLASDAITSLTVLPSHRRRGLMTRMMRADLAAARERGEMAAILVAAEYPIYGRFGFGAAIEMASYRLDARARFRRPPAGRVDLVPATRLLEVAPAVFDRERARRPGQIDRPAPTWQVRVGLREVSWVERPQAIRCATFTGAGGQVEGYLVYRVESHWQRRVPRGTLQVAELMALTPEAYDALWQFCCQVDLVSQVEAEMRRADEPLRWSLLDARAALEQTMRSDFIWLRPLDLPRLLGTRRYASEGRVVIEVVDALGLAGGRFALEGGPSGATCRPTGESADLAMDVGALGALSLGGASLTGLAEAGAVDEARPGAVLAAAALLQWPVAPWCSTFF